jgi:hypothetical protein
LRVYGRLGQTLLKKKSLKTSLKIIGSIVLKAVVLTVVILVLNGVGFWLYDVLVVGEIFSSFYWIVSLEGLFMIAYAIFALSREYSGIYGGEPLFGYRRYTDIHFPPLGRY